MASPNSDRGDIRKLNELLQSVPLPRGEVTPVIRRKGTGAQTNSVEVAASAKEEKPLTEAQKVAKKKFESLTPEQRDAFIKKRKEEIRRQIAIDQAQEANLKKSAKMFIGLIVALLCFWYFVLQSEWVKSISPLVPPARR